MLRRERIIKRFILGISVLTSYISYTGSLNMHDINIIAERFMCDLLNILYGAELTNANDIVRNNSGYDLISKSKKIIVQVSSSDTPEKIANTIEIIEKKVFEYWQWKCRLEDIRKQREINPSSYTSNVYENEEKLWVCKACTCVRGFQRQNRAEMFCGKSLWRLPVTVFNL